ncbi:tripartite tricarboxylate transporter substrate binding protein [Piscinibacter koreensis]|uniref:Tripartite tricarboxylate transporter substrate binding protein n=1 Tax=Piscinibacter koreensis TaxID=2742824 RepID=A0A7Y6NRF2_9BURK|nr:tripartite tricarboxylate transporter substrate binding protein [Schlegelella koreensis]NUZ07948.1 tripartite tricarboxylate transporter substrate binding protein [Schlegelella koreensis]
MIDSRQRRRLLLLTAAGGAGLLPVRMAIGQTFPTRPVRLIVPYGVGTVSDGTARLFADKLAAVWGQSLLVENVTGAGGVIGTQAIAKAAPDGYTLGMLASNHAMNAALYPQLPYDPVKDFQAVLHISFNQFAFCVHSAVPARTLQEFVAYARAHPGELNYSSSGNGGSPHLAMAKLASMAQIQLAHIPYRSNGAAITDLVGGRVTIMSTSVSALLPFIKTGQLRALAVSGDQRSPLLPDVPTAAEAGVPGYVMKNWNGFVAPAGLPQSLLTKLQADLMNVLRDKAVQAQFAVLGVEPEALGPAEFTRRLEEEITSWKKVVREAHVKLD